MAFWALVTRCGLTVVATAHRLLTTDWGAWVSSQVHSFVRNGRRLEVTPAIAVGTVVLQTAVALAVAAFLAFLAARAIRGYRWPRIVLTIMVALMLASLATDGFASWADDSGLVSTILNAVVSIALAVGTVLLWLPVSSGFVRRATAERRRFNATRLR
ncbi:hypothetical protein [Leifsonia xyli]|uniref:hypothetical protein n=1 Tax=Leifsonia xyli TaxID=1575 RepID=UPI003D66D101